METNNATPAPTPETVEAATQNLRDIAAGFRRERDVVRDQVDACKRVIEELRKSGLKQYSDLTTLRAVADEMAGALKEAEIYIEANFDPGPIPAQEPTEADMWVADVVHVIGRAYSRYADLKKETRK